MHNLRQNFDIVLPIIQELLVPDVNKDGNIPKPGPKPKFSDCEVIALSLVADSLRIDSEHYLFEKLHRKHGGEFPNLIERSVYNKRRRFLVPWIHRVRKELVHRLGPCENTYVLDSMPVEICKFARAILSDELQTELFERNGMLLNTPMRANQKQFRKQPALFRKVRKRIETIFSQLCDQFMIRRNYAKSFHGLAYRILSKITAFTLLQYINKLITGRPLNHVKNALAYVPN